MWKKVILQKEWQIWLIFEVETNIQINIIYEIFQYSKNAMIKNMPTYTINIWNNSNYENAFLKWSVKL